MNLLKYLFALCAIAIFTVSCDKNNTPLNTDELDLADDDAVTEAVFDDIFSNVDNATQALDLFFSKGEAAKGEIILSEGTCPIITVNIGDETTWPKIITIDFGDGCEGLYNQTRAGKIIIAVTGPRREEGSTRTVTFENYFFNGIGVQGTKVTENLGANDNGNVVFSASLTGGLITLPNDTTIAREFSREREWIAGYDTWNIWDDECLVTGFANGTTYKGATYENKITSALHWKRVCKFIVSGVIEINRSGIEAFELDYGDGECDAIAVLRRGTEEKEITLRHKHRKFR